MSKQKEVQSTQATTMTGTTTDNNTSSGSTKQGNALSRMFARRNSGNNNHNNSASTPVSSPKSSAAATRSASASPTVHVLVDTTNGSTSARTTVHGAQVEGIEMVSGNDALQTDGQRPPRTPGSSSSSPRFSTNHKTALKEFEKDIAMQEVEYSDREIMEERRKLKERDGFCLPVIKYDGQHIWCTKRSKPDYILGNYLGGGVAGVVYEAERCVEQQSQSQPGEQVAVKILNPVSFRLASPSSLIDVVIVREGIITTDEVLRRRKPMTEKHVWWVVNPNSRNLRTLRSRSSNLHSKEPDRGSKDKGLRLSLIAAYRDETGLKELPLNRCIEIWGHAPFGTSEDEFEELMDRIERENSSSSAKQSIPLMTAATTSSSSAASSTPPTSPSSNMCPVDLERSQPSTSDSGSLLRAVVSQRSIVHSDELSSFIAVPAVPPKYLRWLRQRRAATKEIRNMMRIGRHDNVVHLYEVLEYVQESKSTMFLILELVTGGELFDLISSPNANRMHSQKSKYQGEGMMRKFFGELVSGISYCHQNGIAHRDLKPENLLVHYHGGVGSDSGDCTLKIADFGLSAAFGLAEAEANASAGGTFVNGGGYCNVGGGSVRPRAKTAPNAVSLNSNGNNSEDSSSIFRARTLSEVLALPAKAAFSFNSLLTCGAVSNITTNDDIQAETLASGFCYNLSNDVVGSGNHHPASPLRRMTSVVGSPHYVAPEIISQESLEQSETIAATVHDSDHPIRGYDGTKADVWSAGVILYAMLFRSLPFGEDLLRCPRYISFNKWYRDVRGLRRRKLPTKYDLEDESMLGPKWFFPSDTSASGRDLIVCMLNPDPHNRLSIGMVQKHPWVIGTLS
uniref:non-specific serine/threonine protein kinase n=1 Tax=Leptocylindrus danicus TaxID=163516 RepID=A0A6U2QBP5_9STRA|mmetsp:Transcript_30305/g.44580  ORF Transcript_30305/g.44580 Transcript_30305/m.44580 type:complete len:850 (+) Transcript_30305:140-2689(+)